MGSDASEPNLQVGFVIRHHQLVSYCSQVFMDNFVCQANDMGVGYFFFEVRRPVSRLEQSLIMTVDVR